MTETATATPAEQAYAALSEALARWSGRRASIDVLEIGGGSATWAPFACERVLTVVDISPEQIERSTAAHKILGDAHEVPFGDARYDAAVAWDVIEHLADPRLVIAKAIAAIRPGGIVVLAAPHSESLAGAVTKYTPHGFHVWVHRHLFGNAKAGTPGWPPFPAVHHSGMASDAIRAWAARGGLEELFFHSYESSRGAHLRKTSPVGGALFDLALLVGNGLTGRRLELSDYFLVLRKPPVSDGEAV